MAEIDFNPNPGDQNTGTVDSKLVAKTAAITANANLTKRALKTKADVNNLGILETNEAPIVVIIKTLTSEAPSASNNEVRVIYNSNEKKLVTQQYGEYPDPDDPNALLVGWNTLKSESPSPHLIYCDKTTNELLRWNGNDFEPLSFFESIDTSRINMLYPDISDGSLLPGPAITCDDVNVLIGGQVVYTAGNFTGYVPTSRTINSKKLTGDVTLYGTDVKMSSTDSTTVNAAIGNRVLKTTKINGTSIGTGISNLPINEADLKWGGKNLKDTYSPVDACMIPYLSGNKFALFSSATGCTITAEYSTNGGTTWQTYTDTTHKREMLFCGDEYYQSALFWTGGDTTQAQNGGHNSQLKITVDLGNFTSGTAVGYSLVYLQINKIAMNFARAAARTINNTEYKPQCRIIGYAWNKTSKTHTTTIKNDSNWFEVSGWPNWSVFNPTSRFDFGGTSSSNNARKWEFIFRGDIGLSKIVGFGPYSNNAGYTTGLKMAHYGNPYTIDYLGNAAFQASVTQNSDERLKKNITKITNNTDMPDLYEFDMRDSGEHAYGVIAQELEKTHPELVLTGSDIVEYDPETMEEISRVPGYKSVKYWETHSMMIAKLCNKIEQLENEIEELKKK